MEVLRKAPDPIFDSNLIPEFSEKTDDDDKKNLTTTTKNDKNGVGEEGGWGWGRVGGVRGMGWGQVKNTDRDKEPRPLPPALPAHKQQVKGPKLDQKFDV